MSVPTARHDRQLSSGVKERCAWRGVRRTHRSVVQSSKGVSFIRFSSVPSSLYRNISVYDGTTRRHRTTKGSDGISHSLP